MEMKFIRMLVEVAKKFLKLYIIGFGILIREILHKSKVFNDKNNNNAISFDELLVNRRFNSFIYKYDNVYGNRSDPNYIEKRPGNFTQRHKMNYF